MKHIKQLHDYHDDPLSDELPEKLVIWILNAFKTTDQITVSEFPISKDKFDKFAGRFSIMRYNARQGKLYLTRKKRQAK